MNEKRRELILETVRDLVADFLYYDRKEDEELGPDEIDEAIDEGDLTIDEITEAFRDEVRKRLEAGW